VEQSLSAPRARYPHPPRSPGATRGLVALLLLALPLASAAAQRPRVEFERIAQDHGLSNGTVTAMVQDRVGFLWLGTEDGLDRYDGSSFTVYRPVPRDSSSLSDPWITALAVGHDGTLWVGTLHGGVNRYDPRTQRFRHYRNRVGDPQSLSDDHVNTLYETSDGTLWVGTKSGLDRLDPATGRVQRYAPDTTDFLGYTRDVLSIADDGAGALWVGMRHGLFRFVAARGTFEPLPLPVAPLPARAMLRDRRGMIWIGVENELIAVDPRTDSIVLRYRSATPAHPSPIGGRVLTLHESADGRLWIGSERGLAALDPVTRRFVRYRHDATRPASLGGNIVRSVLVDRGGVLWAGVESYGLNKYAPAAVRFTVLRHTPDRPGGLSDGYVRGITQGPRGAIWIGTQFGGLDRLDPRTGRITVYRHRRDDPRSLPGDNVWAILFDRSGTMWVGLQEHGLGTFDPRTGAFTPFPLVPSDASVNTLYEDKGGNLWVGLDWRGLIRISPDRRRARTYGDRFGDVRVLATGDVQTIVEDSRGALWVGGDGGLTELDRRAGRVVRFHAAPGHPDALGGDFITNVVEDRGGRIWVATKGGGLNLLDRATGRFTHIGTAEGLPHSFVYGILEDARGHLWISTDDGIAMLDPATRAITRYGLEDGLQAREFNRRAFYRAPDGTMYMGGVNGVSIFRPDDAAPAPPPPPVSLLALHPSGAAPRPLIGHPADSVIALPYDQNAFTVSFTALDFTAPRKTHYAYRLDGVDHTWISAGDRREASYASVPPGRYVFRVTAATAGGVWNPLGATLTLVIARPWWATWWARLVAAALVLALPVGVARIRLRAARRRSARLEQRIDEQMRDLTEAQARLRAALDRERESARELFEITAAVPGAMFQLREGPDGTRSFPFVSEGIGRLYHGDAPAPGHAVVDDEPPSRIAERLFAHLHPDDVDALEHSLARSRDRLEPWRAELRWAAPGRETRWLAVQAHPRRQPSGAVVWTGVLTDATALRRADAERAALEAKMQQAQRAESLGILAGGIAHDFNNLLVGVLANTELLPLQLAMTEEAAETLGYIRASALQAAQLTQQMLAYAGKSRLVMERLDLAGLVRDMLALLRSAVPRTIAFELHAGAVPAIVEADPTQLRQVVMNLVTNASEAIGDHPGRVEVRVGVTLAVQQDLALLHAAADMPRHGPYAVLEVTDDGCGMDASLLGRIFDPFYSTKFTGRGLGLAALLGIVRAHHGGIHVDTTPGRGSRFVIYLPLAAALAPAIAAAGGAGDVAAPPTRERVLVVDDEDAVLLSTARLLTRLGYEVVTAPDGAAALAAASQNPPFDLILLDVTMPAMDGPATARALRERGVEVPIILMSGYAENQLIARGAMTDADGFLKKPFLVQELAAVVHELTARQAR
jgi:ligand-binding sensor domain-containing protein/signal transduction histidine kinase/CheY-like chemotaxis protein